MLGDLEDRFNALEEGSKNMVSQVCTSVSSVIDEVLKLNFRQNASLLSKQRSLGLEYKFPA